MTEEHIKKITNKTVIGAEIPKDPKKAKAWYKLYGVIRSYTTETSDMGEYQRFKGDFLAVMIDTNHRFRSSVCIVPKPLDDMLAQQYEAMIEELTDPDTGELKGSPQVQFSAEIGYKPGKTPTGYEWTVRPLIEMRQNDALTAMEAEVAKQLPAK